MKPYQKIHRVNLLAVLLLLCAQQVSSYGQNLVEYNSIQDKGLEAVKAVRDIVKDTLPNQGNIESEDPENLLNKIATKAGVSVNWDPKNNRWAGIGHYRIKRLQAGTATFNKEFGARHMAAMGAMIQGQVALAKWYGASASVELALSNPTDPGISEQQATADSAKARAAKIKKDLENLTKDLSEAESNSIGSLLSTRFSIAAKKILDRVAPPSDTTDAENQKKQELIAGIQAQIEEYNKEIKSLEAVYTDYQNNFRTRTLNKNLKLHFEHYFVGMSAIAMAEKITDSYYDIAILFVWSPKLANTVTSMLTGVELDNSIKAKGDMTYQDWIVKQDPVTLPPIGNYFDNEGRLWFYGAGMVPDTDNDATEKAEYFAEAALYLSLNNEMVGQVIQTSQLNDGNLGNDYTDKLLQDFRAKATINTQGLSSFGGLIKYPVLIKGKPSSVGVRFRTAALSADSRKEANKQIFEQSRRASMIARDNNRRDLEIFISNALVKKAQTEVSLPIQAAPKKPAVKSMDTPKTSPVQNKTAPDNGEATMRPGVNVSPTPKPNF